MENLPAWGVTADVGDRPSETASINHWMNCHALDTSGYPNSTLFVAHIDRPARLWALKKRLETARLGICMSRMTVDSLVRNGVPPEKLCWISPAHDGVVKPRRIVIGISSQVRPDKAKREDLLVELARRMRLSAFHFKILGKRWEEVILHLESAGATVEYFPGTNDYVADYQVYLEQIPLFDYYLYTGLDEGSMGFLDALAAGVPTIVTPQGFHLDVEGGITHAFVDIADLCRVFESVASERARLVDSVARLTWGEYARRHALAWRDLLGVGPAETAERPTDVPQASRQAPADWRRVAPRLGMGGWFRLRPRAFVEDVALVATICSGRQVEETRPFRSAASLYHALRPGLARVRNGLRRCGFSRHHGGGPGKPEGR